MELFTIRLLKDNVLLNVWICLRYHWIFVHSISLFLDLQKASLLIYRVEEFRGVKQKLIIFNNFKFLIFNIENALFPPFCFKNSKF